MKRSKRFAAWVIALKSDQLTRAHLKLTLLYIFVMALFMAILLGFTLWAIKAEDHDLRQRHRFDRSSEYSRVEKFESPLDESLEILESLASKVVWVYLATVAVAGAASYFFARYTLRPVRRSIEAQQQFFANAAHDLRTPLSVVKTEAEVALRSPELSKSEIRKVLESSIEEVDRMSALVDEMLELGSLGSGQLKKPLELESHDIVDIVVTSVERLARRAHEKSVQWIGPDSPHPTLLNIDARAVERALENVLLNALHYTSAGGSVTTNVHLFKAAVEIEVADTGIGIPAEDIPHVTEAFYRADSARTAHTGGAGLGLAIVQRIMTQHSGSLSIESRVGFGTKVRLRFRKN